MTAGETAGCEDVWNWEGTWLATGWGARTIPGWRGVEQRVQLVRWRGQRGDREQLIRKF